MNKDELIELVVDYAEKVFFYSVKRCNNRMDAEDLSQTILLEIIQNINKGAQIDNLDHYIWKVCKNQFNMYLRKTIKDRNNINFVEEVDQMDEAKTSLEKLIEDEKIIKMNKAIKLLSKDYAQILYAYYIEDKTLKFISEELNMPLGTIKWKLFKIREKLKEYLDMEKLNGKKAYIPKEFVGIMGGCSNFDPHEFTSPLMIKNLLYHSFLNPCTLDDYSIELGISRPYVEDYVTKLLNKEFLVKLDNNKYVTNIAFIDKKLRREIYDYVRDNISKFSDEVIKFSKSILEDYKKMLINQDIADEHLMWSLICLVIVNIESMETNVVYSKHYSIDNQDTSWDYLMAEYLDSIYSDEFFVSYNTNEGNCDGADLVWFPSSIEKNEVSKIMFWKREINVYELMERAKEINNLTEEELTYSALKGEAKEKVDEYIKCNFLKVKDDKIVLTTPCITEKKYQELVKLIRQSCEAGKELRVIYDAIRMKLKDYLTLNLYPQLDFILRSIILSRSHVLTKAYDEGLLKDEDGKYFPYNKLVIMKK